MADNSNNDAEKALGSAAIVGVALVCISLLLFWQAIVLSWLWLWFVVPIGAPPISMPAAFGFVTIVHLLTIRPQRDTPEFKTVLTAYALGPAWCWLLGYIAKSWM